MLLENVEVSEETRVIVVSFSVPNADFSPETSIPVLSRYRRFDDLQS